MKKLISKVENGLIYIGYTAGILLLLENMAGIIKDNSNIGLRIFLFSVFLWAISRISRIYIFGDSPRVIGAGKKTRLELLYFIFCHTFTIIFVSTIVRYTPIGYSGLGGYSSYSGFVNYFTRDFIFLFLINIIFFLFFIWTLYMTSKLLFRAVITSSNFVSSDVSRMGFVKILSFALVITLAFAILNIPVVWDTVHSYNQYTGSYMKAHYQWLVDYVIGSPVFYYAFTSFKGSELVEDFSLYKRLI